MAPFGSPDFIVNCYSNLDSLKSKDRFLLDSFFLSVKKHKSIDGGLDGGGKEKFKVDISNNIDSFDGEITLSNDSFVLKKDVTFKNGKGYVVEFRGHRKNGEGGRVYYFGTYTATDKITNKANPYYGGSFQTSATHFFRKYNLN